MSTEQFTRAELDEHNRIEDAKRASRVRHTPGPWTIEQSYDPRTGPHVYVNAEIENNGTSAPSGTFSVAEISDDTYVIPYGSQEANARLITAAPDLLAACKGALEEFSEWEGPEEEETSGQYAAASRARNKAVRAYGVIRAAVAKAEGRS